MRDLVVKFDDNSVFNDISQEMRDYLRDDFTTDFISAEDLLYNGLFKPFFSVFIEVQTAPSGSANLSAEYFDGTAWQPLAIQDDTNGLSRSGFISWERDIEDSWELGTVDSDELFWIRFSVDSDLGALTMRGDNMLLSDDNDLRSEQRQIDDQLARGDISFVAYQLAARNEIIQTLRNGGYFTKTDSAVAVNDLNVWDILKPDQLRNASKFLVLSKIMFDVSSNVDDKWQSKSREYRNMFGEAFKLYILSLDFDDDGKNDNAENNFFRVSRFTKV